MFRHLLATTALCLVAGTAANAQMSFSHGDVTLGVGTFSGGMGGLYIIDAAARGAYDIGSFGLQLNGKYTAYTDFTNSVGFGVFDAHLYRPSASGHKYGAYLGATVLPYGSSIIGSAGVEAMFDFGAFDLEASAGALFSFSGGSGILGTASAAAYYDISPTFEVSAGVNGVFDNSGGAAVATLGASYHIPNSDFSVSGYASTPISSGGSTVVYGLRLSYALGDNSDDRLFSARGYNMLLGPP